MVEQPKYPVTDPNSVAVCYCNGSFNLTRYESGHTLITLTQRRLPFYQTEKENEHLVIAARNVLPTNLALDLAKAIFKQNGLTPPN